MYRQLSEVSEFPHQWRYWALGILQGNQVSKMYLSFWAAAVVTTEGRKLLKPLCLIAASWYFYGQSKFYVVYVLHFGTHQVKGYSKNKL